MKRRTLASTLTGGALLLPIPCAPLPVRATTVTTTFAVNMTIQATCKISALPLAFGTYSGLLLNGSTTISITCSNTTNYSVGLDPGDGPGATVANRLMTSGDATVPYGLFRDAARSLNWGQTAPTDTVAGVGTGSAQVLTVYGRVTAERVVTPGTYTDVITATVTY